MHRSLVPLREAVKAAGHRAYHTVDGSLVIEGRGTDPNSPEIGDGPIVLHGRPDAWHLHCGTFSLGPMTLDAAWNHLDLALNLNPEN